MRPVYHQTDERVEATSFRSYAGLPCASGLLRKSSRSPNSTCPQPRHYKRYARSGSSTYSWVLGGLSASSRAAPLAPTRS